MKIQIRILIPFKYWLSNDQKNFMKIIDENKFKFFERFYRIVKDLLTQGCPQKLETFEACAKLITLDVNFPFTMCYDIALCMWAISLMIIFRISATF